MIYVARRPLNTGGVDVQVIGEAIARIRKENDDLAVPAAYVEAARPEDSPIHKTLPWDQKDALFEAALRRRAAEFCQWIVAEQQEYPNASVELISTSDGERVRGYMEVALVERQARTREQVLADLLGTIRGTLLNHKWLTELQPLFEALDQIERTSKGDEAKAA